MKHTVRLSVLRNERCLVVLLFLLVLMEQKQVCFADELPIVIAHRGASSERPEETFASYDLAASLGADYVEVDVCVTKDGVLIARHDCELSTTTNVAEHPEFADRKRESHVYVTTDDENNKKRQTRAHGNSHKGFWSEDFTWAEIQTLRTVERFTDRYQGFNQLFQVLSLEQFLRTVRAVSESSGRQFGVYIETKTPTYFRSINLPMEEKLLDLLEHMGYSAGCAETHKVATRHLRSTTTTTTTTTTTPHRYGRKRWLQHHNGTDTSCVVQAECGCLIFIQSFEADSLKRIRTLNPTYPLIQLLGHDDEFIHEIDPQTTTFGDLMTDEGLHSIAEYADGIGPYKGSFLSNATIQLSVDDIHDHDLLVHVYTFRPESRFVIEGDTMHEEVTLFLRRGIDGVFADDVATAVSARAILLDISTISMDDSDSELESEARTFGSILMIVIAIVGVICGTMCGVLSYHMYLHRKPDEIQPVATEDDVL